jgi:hypothetical protein
VVGYDRKLLIIFLLHPFPRQLMFGDMFHLIFLKDENIDCESESYDSQAAADFCNASSPLYSYLRVSLCLTPRANGHYWTADKFSVLTFHPFAYSFQVYAIIIGDFNLTDFQQDSIVTVMWFLVTFIGLVVMLNTLIAVITTSYDRSEKTSIILFRRARCEILASNAALEGFLSPRIFTGSREECKPHVGVVVASIARWSVIVTFGASFMFSSLYLIQRLITAVNQAEFWTAVAMIFLCLVMAYTLWAAFVVFTGWILGFCCEESARASLLIKAANTYVVEKVAAQMFGVDPTDTRGGEVIRLDGDDGHDTVLYDRIDKMERLLERILEQNVAKEIDDADLDGGGNVLDKSYYL